MRQFVISVEEKKNIIWVYGSLRDEEYNHYIISQSREVEFIDIGTVRGFKMYSFGAFPFVYETGNPEDKIVVEGYKVDSLTLYSIDQMEIGAGYHLKKVKIEGKEERTGLIYVMNEMYKNIGEVKDGDWKNKDELYLGEYIN